MELKNKKQGDEQPRYDTRQKESADRLLDHDAENDQHDAGRDHGAERTAGDDRADGEMLVVVQTQHLRQRDHAEQDDLTADDAAHRGEDDGDQQRGIRIDFLDNMESFNGNFVDGENSSQQRGEIASGR